MAETFDDAKAQFKRRSKDVAWLRRAADRDQELRLGLTCRPATRTDVTLSPAGMVELASAAVVSPGRGTKVRSITDTGTMSTNDVRAMPFTMTTPAVIAASESVGCSRKTA